MRNREKERIEEQPSSLLASGRREEEARVQASRPLLHGNEAEPSPGSASFYRCSSFAGSPLPFGTVLSL